ncbi:MAG TPA: PAS domain S-box protein, partial [Tepidisphaeraceae bacterium]|nr:PAS domain S-box protein [Tepidisphaeraceae bacterium]
MAGLRAVLAHTIFPSGLPFLLFLPAVMISAWFGGFWPAILATALSATIADLWLMPTTITRVEQIGGLVLFVLVNVTIAALVESIHRTRRRAEAHATESRKGREVTERLASIVESSDDAIIGHSLDGIMTSWNRGAQEMYGYTAGEAIGQPTILLMPPDHQDDMPSILNHIRRGLRVEHFETKRRRKDGRELDVSISVSPIRDANGQIVGASKIARDITAQKKSEQALQRANDRFRLAAAAVSSIIYDWEFATNRVERSIGLLDVLGFRPDEAEPTMAWWRARIHPDDLPRIDREMKEHLDRGDTYECEFRIRHRNGEYKHVWDRAVCVRNGGQEITRVVGSTIDISARVRAEESLRQREREFRTISEAIPQMVWTTNADGVADYMNRQWYEYTGRQPGDTSWQDVVHPESIAQTVAAWEKSVRAGEPFEIEYRLKAKDGSYRWFLGRGQPLRDDDGKIFRWFGTCTDVDDQKRALDSARESENRFRAMANSASALVWIAGTDKLCTWFNNPWLEFTGRTMQQECGNGWTEGVHPDDLGRCLETYVQSFDARKNFRMEYRLRRHDGEYRWLLDNGVPRFGSSGEFLGYIGSCIDITDIKRAEEQRNALLASERAARSDAERAGRMKDEFLATLSHELRTPLNAILGWSQLLRTGRLDQTDVEQGLETVERNAKIQAQLIEDLLDMSRIISGKLRLDVQRVELPPVIEAAIETVKPAADAKGIHLHRIIDHQAGAVMVDPARLQQIVWNLLSNAIKFTPSGGRVQILLERVENFVRISVMDTGEGIAQEFLPYVFERFRQADPSTTRKHMGLGLGLAIVRHLSELHGGTVQATSCGEGHGATFTVTLPSASTMADDPRAHLRPNRIDTSRAIAPVPDHNVLRGLKVLVVDDEPDARELVRRLLRDYGAEVATAGSVKDAMNTMSAEKIDVLLSDIGMPGFDGYDLIRRLRSLPPNQGGDIPAVALTAFARFEDRQRAI